MDYCLSVSAIRSQNHRRTNKITDYCLSVSAIRSQNQRRTNKITDYCLSVSAIRSQNQQRTYKIQTIVSQCLLFAVKISDGLTRYRLLSLSVRYSQSESETD